MERLPLESRVRMRQGSLHNLTLVLRPGTASYLSVLGPKQLLENLLVYSFTRRIELTRKVFFSYADLVLQSLHHGHRR